MPGEGDCRDLCLFILAPCRMGQARPFISEVATDSQHAGAHAVFTWGVWRLGTLQAVSGRQGSCDAHPQKRSNDHLETRGRPQTSAGRRDKEPLSDRPVQLQKVTDSCHRGACLNFSASQCLNVTIHERPASTLFKQRCLLQN